MLKRKHMITICVDVEHHLKTQRFVDDNVKTIGGISNYIDDRKSYTTFETTMDITTIANELQLLNRNETSYFTATIMGSLIIVN